MFGLVVAKKPYLIKTLGLSLMLCPCPYMETNDDSYHMPVWIGIGISIGKISSSVLGIKTLEKCGIGPPLVIILSPDPSSQHLPINAYYRHTHIHTYGKTLPFCSAGAP